MSKNIKILLKASLVVKISIKGIIKVLIKDAQAGLQQVFSPRQDRVDMF